MINLNVYKLEYNLVNIKNRLTKFQRQYQRCEEIQPEAEVPAGRALDADAETTEGRGKTPQLGAER